MNKRHRSYCFTWNNYTVENIDTLTQAFMEIGVKKYIFQEEIGEENNVHHLQGVVCFNNPIWFNTMKRIDNRIHWEPCRDLKGSIRYCSKELTRKKGSSPYKYGIKDTETCSSDLKRKIRFKDIGPDKSYLAMRDIMIAEVQEHCSREMNKIRLERLYHKEDVESEDWLFRNNRTMPDKHHTRKLA